MKKQLLGNRGEPLTDYYEILGVTPSASQKAIKKAFRKRARRYHPDVNQDDPSANKKFAALARAYDKLRTEEKRNEVDAEIISDYCMSFLYPNKTNNKDRKKNLIDFNFSMLKDSFKGLGKK